LATVTATPGAISRRTVGAAFVAVVDDDTDTIVGFFGAPVGTGCLFGFVRGRFAGRIDEVEDGFSYKRSKANSQSYDTSTCMLCTIDMGAPLPHWPLPTGVDDNGAGEGEEEGGSATFGRVLDCHVGTFIN
jgi:hypothetical protein